jgi:leucyl-tRNA synthetase
MINSRFLNGLTTEAAKEEVARRLEKELLPLPAASSVRPRESRDPGVRKKELDSRLRGNERGRQRHSKFNA